MISRMAKLLTMLFVAIAAPVVAQVQTGSILVRASDEQGAVTPGVSITISSPVLVAGSIACVFGLIVAALVLWR